MRGRKILEAGFWTAGLVAVAAADPASGGLLSTCLFDHLGAAIGLDFCPGCGLGHAVGYLARGHVSASLAAHPLAVPAVLILSSHIVGLIRSASTQKA
ncbi:MAG: DUF2752 domain-containing protein [Rhodothermales bacterium]|nr:DUF2752 domain-containing protein [Rhodothermales bacterium]MBO6779143.1 DUF2752 domain-containing protein [Rhodothermales bacterium]